MTNGPRVKYQILVTVNNAVAIRSTVCLRDSSAAVKRHHDHDDSYKRKCLIERVGRGLVSSSEV